MVARWETAGITSARWKEEVLNSFGPDYAGKGSGNRNRHGKAAVIGYPEGRMVLLGRMVPNSDDIYLTATRRMAVLRYRWWTGGKKDKYTIQEAIDEPILWYKGSLVIGKVLEDSKRGDLYTEIYLVDPGGRTSQLTHNGGWKNGFRCWADQLAYVRGDTTDLSYLLYVEIISLP